MYTRNVREIIEALIFSSDGALEIKDILKVLPGISENEVESMVNELNKIYDETGRSFMITRASNGYMFVSRDGYTQYIKALMPPFRLSRASLEVLAVIAYKGPCTKQDIDLIRGVDSSSSLKTLVHHELVNVIAGRPLRYVTSKKFLEVFGLNSLSELPDLDQFEELFGKA
ncbi:MAG: SMC-Scp complex subunit ScpB [Deltaproteobacteria bacterium]|nr:MAG: SMC-Scp complex subunit ScpB [Deltaproteobacteria bacterium]